MTIPTTKKLESCLRAKYNISIGQLSLEELRRKVSKILKSKIEITGRSYKTGEKKTVAFSIKNLFKEK